MDTKDIMIISAAIIPAIVSFLLIYFYNRNTYKVKYEKGWACPSCGAVHAPKINRCKKCKTKVIKVPESRGIFGSVVKTYRIQKH